MRTDLMLDSLDGLSVGDSLGQVFPIVRRSTVAELRAGSVPPAPWGWTDDTEMACSVVAELLERGGIEQDRLALAFANRFDAGRDYGWWAQQTMNKVRRGVHWRKAAGAVYNGEGSCGNGGAMRVAPLGAFYADKPDRVVAEAVRSAQVTHLHPEGVAGAVAVALAAAHAGRARIGGTRPVPAEFITAVLERLEDGETAQLIRRARELVGAPAERAAEELGTGIRVLSQDTVPFTMWVAATYLDDYPTAITTCIAAGGDSDTTSAIVGGIVAAYTGGGAGTGVPESWIASREALPAWFEQIRETRSGRKPGSGLFRRWFSGRPGGGDPPRPTREPW
ncbi:ADP-ribosylglycohydrolase family protein [Nocardia alni]|uniref:ADP-ribosylglycohydrolase family protein n=1 Tax=Nocardia alni TaxID=2815723 RepID=UPI0020B3BDC4|nr:ADP-ribosylglycohydrolase family protein [Nocardia alni]